MNDSTFVAVELAQSIVRERDELRRTLERISQRIADDLGDMPDSKCVPRNFAAGVLLAIQGLAQSALE